MSLWLWLCLCDVLTSLCAQEHCKDFFVLKMNCNFRGQDFFTVLMQLIPHFFGTLATMNLEKAVFTAQGVEVWPIFGTEQAQAHHEVIHAFDMGIKIS